MALAMRASPSTGSCALTSSLFRASRSRRTLVVCAVLVLTTVFFLKTQLLDRCRNKTDGLCQLDLVLAAAGSHPGTLSPTSGQRSPDSPNGSQFFIGAPRQDALCCADRMSHSNNTHARTTPVSETSATHSPRAEAKTPYAAAPAARRSKELSPNVLKEAFQPLMSLAEKALFLSTLQLLEQKLRSQGVAYFLYGGTLLGAYRHRGMIPWDDDVDVIANFTQVEIIKSCLSSVPGFNLYTGDKHRYKLYPTNGASIPKKIWKWPYIDVCFFGENSSHIFDVYPGLEKVYVYPRRDIFPLQYRPFESLSLPVPLREDRVLVRNYELDLCRPNEYSHRRESAVGRRTVTSVSCAQLYAFYPFVFRNSSQMPVKETIRKNGTIFGEFVFS